MSGGAKFEHAQFAYHEDGRIAMRSGRFPVDRWEDSTGVHHSDVGMIHMGFIPLPNLADALIAQQQTMQAGLDEAIRGASERAWDEGVASVQYPLSLDESFARRMEVQSVVALQIKFKNPYRRAES